MMDWLKCATESLKGKLQTGFAIFGNREAAIKYARGELPRPKGRGFELQRHEQEQRICVPCLG